MKKNNLSVLGAGFACLDIIRLQKRDVMMLGGTAANVLTILSQLGIKTEFLTARYYGRAGEFVEEAFKRRGVKCIHFTKTKNSPPRIIEGLENGHHFFNTICPECGQNLVKCSLPTLGQIARIEEKYEVDPNVFFFDRLSEGIRECAKKNKNGWNVYEPNSCRMYSSLINGVRISNIVKYSEDRIPAKITDNIIRDIRDSKVELLIVTMGERGIKYVYRTETGDYSSWNYIAATSIDNVIDSSGSGDWLTAVFLYLFLEKYPNYTAYLDGKYVEQCFLEAQGYASQNCAYIGAQGMLRETNIVNKMNSELHGDAKQICDPEIDWIYNCRYCFNENID